jgi:hypothetical protein
VIDCANCIGVLYKNDLSSNQQKNKLQKLTYTQTTICNKIGLTHASMERFKRRAKIHYRVERVYSRLSFPSG